jgi:hypothetical protein
VQKCVCVCGGLWWCRGKGGKPDHDTRCACCLCPHVATAITAASLIHPYVTTCAATASCSSLCCSSDRHPLPLCFYPSVCCCCRLQHTTQSSPLCAHMLHGRPCGELDHGSPPCCSQSQPVRHSAHLAQRPRVPAQSRQSRQQRRTGGCGFRAASAVAADAHNLAAYNPAAYNLDACLLCNSQLGRAKLFVQCCRQQRLLAVVVHGAHSLQVCVYVSASAAGATVAAAAKLKNIRKLCQHVATKAAARC